MQLQSVVARLPILAQNETASARRRETIRRLEADQVARRPPLRASGEYNENCQQHSLAHVPRLSPSRRNCQACKDFRRTSGGFAVERLKALESPPGSFRYIWGPSGTAAILPQIANNQFAIERVTLAAGGQNGSPPRQRELYCK